MSTEELESELLKLKDINTSNMKRVEDNTQQLYEMNRELSTAKAMEEHISSEIESLEMKDRSVSQNVVKHLEALNEEIMILKRTNAENIETYESQLYDLDLEMQASRENRKIEASSTDEKAAYKEIISENLREIVELESKIEKLLPAVRDSEARYTDLAQTNDVLANKITELSGVMSELQECLNSKKEDLQENKELVHSLQEELHGLHMELDQLKNIPVEKATKGNSLFAEVDDNRVKLKKYLQIATGKYADMKLRYANRSQELRKLHTDYAALTKQIDAKTVLHDGQCNVVEMYKKDFHTLTARIDRVEKELAQCNAATSNEHMTREMKCADELITITRKEVLKLQKEIHSESLARLTSDQQLYDAKQVLNRGQTEAMQLRINVLMLNQTIDELKIRKTTTEASSTEEPMGTLTEAKPEPVSSEPRLTLLTEHKNERITIKHTRNDPFVKASTMKATLKQEEVDVKTEENKENTGDDRVQSGTVKKVQFSANTAEPRITARARRKVTVPCVHIPSIKRE